MYSRASAFGPDLLGGAGIYTSTITANWWRNRTGLARYGFVIGINPAYTPPYTNGEAWCDLIFRPSADKSYTLKDIMAETDILCWRFDAGRRLHLLSFGGYTLYSNTMIPGALQLLMEKLLNSSIRWRYINQTRNANNFKFQLVWN